MRRIWSRLLPRQDAHEAGLDRLIVETVAGIVGPRRRVLYLAAPINGGPRLVEHLRTGGRLDDRFQAQRRIEENKRAATELAEAIRERTHRPVFDPGCFGEYPGWSQADYRAACVAVLRRADAMVCSDGWQYSQGCVLEYVEAAAAGLPVLNAELEPLNAEAVALLLAKAEREVVAVGLPSRPWKAALRAARKSAVHSPEVYTTAASIA